MYRKRDINDYPTEINHSNFILNEFQLPDRNETQKPFRNFVSYIFRKKIYWFLCGNFTVILFHITNIWNFKFFQHKCFNQHPVSVSVFYWFYVCNYFSHMCYHYFFIKHFNTVCFLIHILSLLFAGTCSCVPLWANTPFLFLFEPVVHISIRCNFVGLVFRICLVETTHILEGWRASNQDIYNGMFLKVPLPRKVV